MKIIYAKRQFICENEEDNHVVNVYPECEMSPIIGFGSALTEATAYNYAQMSDDVKKKLLEKCFSSKGANYSYCRIHIGSCDFSLDERSYSKKADLSDFSIEPDRKYVIPFLRDVINASDRKIFFLASPWSPPAFMKDSGVLIQGGVLRKEFYPVYAEYFARFIEEYKKEGVEISAVTVQNEPNASQTWESCRFTPEQEAEFATDYLRPTLDKHGLQDVKILVWDHNKERLYDRARDILSYPNADKAIWGIGFHWYSGTHFDNISLVRQKFDKYVLGTELCCRFSKDKTAENRDLRYANEYCNDLRFGVSGVCDWNMVLGDEKGGPYHNRGGGCSAPLYFDDKNDRIVEDGLFPVTKLFSKACTMGDVSIATSSYNPELQTCAIKHKDGSITLIALNLSDCELPVSLRLNGKVAEFKLPPKSLSANDL